MPAAPDAGGVDEADVAAFALDHRVDGIAHGPGDLAHDGTLLARETIQEARLANVRPADDGDAGLVGLGLVFARWRKLGDHGVEEIAGPDALERGHGLE